MHISYLDHTHTRHQSLSVMINSTKAHHPPETKRKASKVSHHTHGFLFKKKEKKRGEDDKSKNIDDGQVPMFTLAHGHSSLMA